MRLCACHFLFLGLLLNPSLGLAQGNHAQTIVDGNNANNIKVGNERHGVAKRHAVSGPSGVIHKADLSGRWRLDNKSSDDLLNEFSSKLRRAHRRADRGNVRTQRGMGYRDPAFEKTPATQMLPYFLYYSQGLHINQDVGKIVFDYDSKRIRKVYTDERPSTVSLAAAAQGKDDVMVSSWEGEKLIIETVSAIDVKIKEIYELVAGEKVNQLQNTITIQHPFFRKPLTVKLLYNRLLDVQAQVVLP